MHLFPSFSRGWRMSDGVLKKCLEHFPISWAGVEGEGRESPQWVPPVPRGDPHSQGRDSWCLKAVALTPLCPVAQGWHRALPPAFPPWQPPALEREPWEGPRGRELRCRVGSEMLEMLDAVWWHCHIHMQLMGRCCTMYEDKDFICKHGLCDEWQYHVANIF